MEEKIIIALVGLLAPVLAVLFKPEWFGIRIDISTTIKRKGVIKKFRACFRLCRMNMRKKKGKKDNDKGKHIQKMLRVGKLLGAAGWVP